MADGRRSTRGRVPAAPEPGGGADARPASEGERPAAAAAALAARAQAISGEAAGRLTAAMRELVYAAAGLTGFAVETARDVVQFLVRRGQVAPAEGERLLREAEAASVARAHAGEPAPPAAPPAKRARKRATSRAGAGTETAGRGRKRAPTAARAGGDDVVGAPDGKPPRPRRPKATGAASPTPSELSASDPTVPGAGAGRARRKGASRAAADAAASGRDGGPAGGSVPDGAAAGGSAAPPQARQRARKSAGPSQPR